MIRPGSSLQELNLGFIPLSDCAPLVAALEKGFFEQEGLAVTLHRERSWASIRDKVAVGLYDAAHMLYPMPLAMSLGVGGPATPTVTALCLGLNGNAITLGNELYEAFAEAAGQAELPPPQSAAPLKQVVEARRQHGQEPLTFGVVFPTSSHHYELRYWLESAGIDCDADVRIIVLPPPDMPEALRDGRIDGCCVGEPWNSFAVQRGWGRIVVTKQQLWNNGPEKVLGVTRRWADDHPDAHRSLLRAVIAASAWCDEPANREELAALIAGPKYLDVPVDVVRMSMLGSLQYAQNQPPIDQPDFNVFHRYAANFPWRSQAVWHLIQMIWAGQLSPETDLRSVAAQVVQPELYRQAAASLGVPAPTIDDKTEGQRAAPWMLTQATRDIAMPTDLLIDGRSFDPADPQRTLQDAPPVAIGR